MAVHHYGAWKLATAVSGVVSAFVFALDPTVQVALIAATPPTIIGLITLWMQRSLKVEVDGKLSRLLDERRDVGLELKDKSAALSHAEGRREGVEVEQARKSPGIDNTKGYGN